jgi:hypothetical protein
MVLRQYSTKGTVCPDTLVTKSMRSLQHSTAGREKHSAGERLQRYFEIIQAQRNGHVLRRSLEPKRRAAITVKLESLCPFLALSFSCPAVDAPFGMEIGLRVVDVDLRRTRKLSGATVGGRRASLWV